MESGIIKPYTKKGGLLVKVVPKHEHNIYVDLLASIPMGAIHQKQEDVVGTLLVLHELKFPILLVQ